MLTRSNLTAALLLLILQSHICLADAQAVTPNITTRTSDWSGAWDDAHTTATCPDGYLMIGCSLAQGSSYWYSDGLTYEGNGCRGHAKGVGRVKVRAKFTKL